MAERLTPCPVCKGKTSHHAACSVPVLGLPVAEHMAAVATVRIREVARALVGDETPARSRLPADTDTGRGQ